VRFVWASVGAFHLCPWTFTMTEAWAWGRKAGELVDRSDSPRDLPSRRPSHADKRRAWRRAPPGKEIRAVPRPGGHRGGNSGHDRTAARPGRVACNEVPESTGSSMIEKNNATLPRRLRLRLRLRSRGVAHSIASKYSAGSLPDQPAYDEYLHLPIAGTRMRLRAFVARRSEVAHHLLPGEHVPPDKLFKEIT
jgi:hypothetical protein